MIIDASQLLGEDELDYNDVAPCVICSAGHKGLYGPTGTGFAVYSPELTPAPIIYGGNGIASELPVMGSELPEMLEAGTVNTFGICGLSSGIEFIKNYGIELVKNNCTKIERYITCGLREIGAIVYSDYDNKTPIILFNIPGIQSDKLSSMLDEKGICTRSGLHCAPIAHKALRTGNGGAVRVSLGYANTLAEAGRFIDTVNTISHIRI